MSHDDESYEQRIARIRAMFEDGREEEACAEIANLPFTQRVQLLTEDNKLVVAWV